MKRKKKKEKPYDCIVILFGLHPRITGSLFLYFLIMRKLFLLFESHWQKLSPLANSLTSHAVQSAALLLFPLFIFIFFYSFINISAPLLCSKHQNIPSTGRQETSENETRRESVREESDLEGARLHFLFLPFLSFCSFKWNRGPPAGRVWRLQARLERLQGLRLGPRRAQAHLQVLRGMVRTGFNDRWLFGHDVDFGPKRRYSLSLGAPWHLICSKYQNTRPMGEFVWSLWGVEVIKTDVTTCMKPSLYLCLRPHEPIH